MMNEKIYNFHGRRILIVDDIEMFRQIETFRLSLVGFEVEQAENGRQALDMYLEKDVWYYDAIIMDIIMPIMNGHECAKLIREAGREDSWCIPIISISVDTSIENIKASREVGIDDIMDKPTDFILLFDKLERLIKNNDLVKSHSIVKKEPPVESGNRYAKLWKLLIDKNLTKTQLKVMINCSSTTLAKLSKGEKVTNTTLQRICSVLDCQISDIVDQKN